ncbi:excalibur calcium-binding domain-containing protein [Ruegeria sp. R8_2]|nr:excalibur calcium-binding domain-containing protein [Ruegeria sp. R8_1]MBO9415982.1 excalibur calcium-binding domain-containing protein [Ruegeria sp. R8_2]
MSIRDSSLRPVFTDPTCPERQRRADVTRNRALSPLRITLMILMLPITTAAIALSVYLRTSDFDQEEAVLHLVALIGGCNAAQTVLPGPYFEGQPGYHPRNDPNTDGVACDFVQQDALARPQQSSERVGNAKFLRP